jgi:HSP20 family molecular chaperone IbpA
VIKNVIINRLLYLKWPTTDGGIRMTNFSSMYFTDIFDTFFLNWPEATKPPIDHFPIIDGDLDDESSLKGWTIQMAIAGFTEEDIEVWHDNQVLHIKGDNTSRCSCISNRFKSKFHRKLAVANKLNLSESKVSLENGILSIEIPRATESFVGTYLFGKK